MANSVTEFIAESVIRHTPDHGPGFGRQFVRGMIGAKKFNFRDINLKELAQTCFGRDTVVAESRLRQVSARRAQWVGESTEAVDLTAWRDILGAVTTEAQEVGYVEVMSPVENLVGVWESEQDDPNNELLIPHPSVATDPSQDVAPAMPYPMTGYAHYSIRVPVPVKHGLIGQLTLEVCMANRKRQFLDALTENGRVVAREERKRKLRLILGITQNYTVVTADGTATTTATYVTTAGRANLLSDLNLANGPAELDRLLRKFAALRDPLTGEEIEINPTAAFTTRANAFTLGKAMDVGEIRETVGAIEYVGTNPMAQKMPVVTDVKAQRLLETEAGIEGGALSAAEAASFTALGDFPRAFKWRQVKPFESFEAGPGEMEDKAGVGAFAPAFYQDIVYACKCRWWGIGFVYDPYAVLAAYDSD